MYDCAVTTIVNGPFGIAHVPVNPQHNRIYIPIYKQFTMLHYDPRTFTMNEISLYYEPAISQNPYGLTVNNVYKNI